MTPEEIRNNLLFLTEEQATALLKEYRFQGKIKQFDFVMFQGRTYVTIEMNNGVTFTDTFEGA